MLAAGPNGAGKTNLLESLHVATQGFSPRTRQDANLVRHGAAGFDVRASGRGESGDLMLEVGFRPGEGKRARINGAVAESLERVRSAAATLVFTPDRLAVVKAGPAVRRAYVDRAISRLFPARATLAGEYAEALAQRNAALRRAASGVAGTETVEPWDGRVIDAGEALLAARSDALAALEAPFGERAGELGLAGAALVYDPSPITAEVLAARFSADLERGLTGAGPHHDEVRITAGERSCARTGPRASSAWQCSRYCLRKRSCWESDGACRRCFSSTMCCPSWTESVAQPSFRGFERAPRCSSPRPLEVRCRAIPTSCSR